MTQYTLPIISKAPFDVFYVGVPVVGTIAGALLAVLLYILISD